MAEARGALKQFPAFLWTRENDLGAREALACGVEDHRCDGDVRSEGDAREHKDARGLELDGADAADVFVAREQIVGGHAGKSTRDDAAEDFGVSPAEAGLESVRERLDETGEQRAGGLGGQAGLGIESGRDESVERVLRPGLAG